MVSAPDPGFSGETHISSLVVQVKPGSLAEVAGWVDALDQTEVPIASPVGKLIVCLETATLGEVTDRIDTIAKRPGVLGCTLVSHHVEDTAGLDEPVDLSAPDTKEMTP